MPVADTSAAYGQASGGQGGYPPAGGFGGYPEAQPNYGAPPEQSSYGYPSSSGAPSGYPSSPYGQAAEPQQNRGHASDYYSSPPAQGQYGQPAHQSQYGQQPGGAGQEGQAEVQYDEHGNPLPPGERGIGTMALGGVAGFAGSKLLGGGGGMKAAIGGALAAQGAKMLFDKKKDHSAYPNASDRILTGLHDLRSRVPRPAR